MKRTTIYILALLFATLQTFAQSTVNYEYDANNRLKKVTYSSGAVVTYTYDELGNRLSKKVVGSAPNPNIHFYDQKVKAICVEHWDTSGDGELSYDEAAAVTDIGEIFKDNDEIMSFDELQYFTGLTAIDDAAFEDCASLSSVIIPDGVTSIGEGTFYGCRALKTLMLPDGLETIGSGAFEYSVLTSLHIPSSVSSIGGYLFRDCYKLESITVDPANETYDSRGGCNAIVETATNTLIAGCKNTVMPEDLKGIGDGALCGDLFDFTTLTIPESVTSIGDRAFAGNYMIRSFVFPTNLEYVGMEAFSGTGWMSIQPQGMVYINDNIACQYKGSMPANSSFEFVEGTKFISPVVFSYSVGRNVISISLPKSVKYIGYEAFHNCVNMTSVTVYAKTPPTLDIRYRTFPNYLDDMTLYVPYGAKTIYENTTEWKRFKNIVEMEPQPYIVGDTNGDGEVTVGDAVAIVNYILGNPSENFNEAAADVNGDGEVTVSDAVAVVSMCY